MVVSKQENPVSDLPRPTYLPITARPIAEVKRLNYGANHQDHRN